MPNSAPPSTVAWARPGQLLPRRRRLGDAALFGEVGAVVHETGLDVPRDAIARAVDHRRVPGPFEERRRVDAVGSRSEAAHRGELTHPRRTDHAHVGNIAAGDGGDQAIMGRVPRHGRHLDADVGELLHEGVGEHAEIVPLGPHRPHADVTLGRAGRPMSPRLGLGPIGQAERRRERERAKRPQCPIHRLPPLGR